MITSKLKQEPRSFRIREFECLDYGSIVMDPPGERTNEILTLETASGRKCDVAATSWGFYLGPSLNSRLKKEGFRSALMANQEGQLYLVAVEEGRMDRFEHYLAANGSRVLYWLENWPMGFPSGAA